MAIRKILNSRKTSFFNERKKDEIEFNQLYQMRLKHIIKIDQPMVLISQIQRSGGSLLSQLFDGHHECHTHPHELYIGYPNKFNWPELKLSDNPEIWFRNLFEKPTIKFSREGYTKYSRGLDANSDVFPFLFLPRLQRNIFISSVTITDIKSQRDIINCYMTSYFNAWLDNQQLYGSKKYVVAFTPRVNMYQKSLERFFVDYPDGKLVSIIREPKNWYVSANRHSPKTYKDVKKSVQLWEASAKMMLTSKKRYKDKVYLLSFDNLIQDTETTMRLLAKFLGLEFNDVLLTPTFNGFKIKADSVFKVKQYGVINDPLFRYKNLSDDKVEFINNQTSDLYEKVLNNLD